MHQKVSKILGILNMCLFFLSSFIGCCWVIGTLWNFHKNKSFKTYLGRMLPPGVYFTSILWAAFATKSFCQKITTPNFKHIKAAQRALVWLPISPIFYEQLFHTKVLYAAFMCLQFGSLIFWRKDFGAKAAHKMLVKLTPGVYFTNILWTAFAPKSFGQKVTNELKLWEHKSCPKNFCMKKLFVKYSWNWHLTAETGSWFIQLDFVGKNKKVLRRNWKITGSLLGPFPPRRFRLGFRRRRRRPRRRRWTRRRLFRRRRVQRCWRAKSVL